MTPKPLGGDILQTAEVCVSLHLVLKVTPHFRETSYSMAVVAWWSGAASGSERPGIKNSALYQEILKEDVGEAVGLESDLNAVAHDLKEAVHVRKRAGERPKYYVSTEMWKSQL